MFFKQKEKNQKVDRLEFSNDYEYALNILRTIEEDIAELQEEGASLRLEVTRDFHKIVLRYLSRISKR